MWLRLIWNFLNPKSAHPYPDRKASVQTQKKIVFALLDIHGITIGVFEVTIILKKIHFIALSEHGENKRCGINGLSLDSR